LALKFCSKGLSKAAIQTSPFVLLSAARLVTSWHFVVAVHYNLCMNMHIRYFLYSVRIFMFVTGLEHRSIQWNMTIPVNLSHLVNQLFTSQFSRRP